jgi:uncharacterized membrane protein
MRLRLQNEGEEAVPPGWTYNPSTWGERLWLILVALLGGVLSGYLAAYQWGLMPSVWEPWFESGSEQVLHSELSKILPIPDAALGTLAFSLDAVTGAIGGTKRWRTMPWMVVLFGLAVGPLGVVSVLLVIAQAVWLQAWCTLCLVSAVISIIMVGPAMDEVLASLQFLKRASREQASVWRVFWKGERALACGVAE